MTVVDSMLISMLVAATPLIFAATGLAYAERSGVLNIGIEGIMLVSASVGFTAAVYFQNIIVGVIAALVVGFLFGLVMSIFAVYLKVDQTVMGIGFWLAGQGLSSYFWWATIYPLGEGVSVTPFQPIIIPGLSEIPIIGAFMNQNVMTYGAIALAIISLYILRRTSFGLRVRAVGENPWGTNLLGVNVSRTRCICMIISGLFGGLAGSFYTLGTTGIWADNITSGAGFIAIAIIKLASWNPVWSIFGSLIFSFFISIQFQLQLTTEIPFELLLTLPYIVSIGILVFIPKVRKSKPKSLGIPFEGG
ncbi:MAG: ABC transporter permease [Candidatus Thorarchaeota archaeon]